MLITKLSDVGPLKAKRLSEDEMTKYVFKSKRIDLDPSKTYDFALLLGCGDYSILQSRTEQIGKLFQEGNIGKIIATGGVGHASKNRGQSEASVMKGILLEMGLNESDIILEDKSKSTIGNMKNSLKLIRKECGTVGSIIIGTSHFHTKRSEGLYIVTKEKLEKELKETMDVDIATYGTLDGKHDADNWFIEKDSFIPQEAFWLSSYEFLGKIPDMPVEEIEGISKVRK